jgi:flavin reductase (DIM6/NTAB) family NADH-FMN oxidoreductase RutF
MKKIITIDPLEISQGTLHNYLLSAVAPRPICFASTISANGEVNLSPFSFFNVFSSNPPIMIFSPARSGRDNSTKHTHDNVLEIKEVVINIVNYPMVEQMSLASTAYEKGVNEFVKAGFTQVDSVKVKPPRVGEAPVAFECVVDEVKPLGTGPGAGNLVIARVVLIHIDEQYVDAHGNLDTTKLDLVGRMGGAWYNRCTQDALFSIPKPITTKGIGIDGLPKYIRESNELTGNELARMGNLPELPNDKEVEIAYSEIVKPLMGSDIEVQRTLINLAKEMISKDQADKALSLLMNFYRPGQ